MQQFTATPRATLEGVRDDFGEDTKRILAQRVGGQCSNPTCRAKTSGPQVNPAKALNVGVAAHITGASPEGPRYREDFDSDARKHPSNGIWLCQNCAKLVDNDEEQFPETTLRAWKAKAEQEALGVIGKTVIDSARSGYVEVQHVLVRAQSKTHPLSEVIAQALTVSKRLRLEALNSFCERELLGWKGTVATPPEYRLSDVFISVNEINTSYYGWAGNTANILSEIRRNPEAFRPFKILFTQSIAELQAEADRSGPKSMIMFRTTLGSLFPGCKSPETPIFVYGSDRTFADILEGVRKELTRLLIETLRSEEQPSDSP